MSELHVHVDVGGEQYALPVSAVREIGKFGAITPVPGAPAEVLGVWNLRGDVVAVIDLSRLLGLDPDAAPNRVVICEAGNGRAGLGVSSVLNVGPLPASIEPADSRYLVGATLIDRIPVGVLDVAAVFGAVTSGSAR